MARSSVTVRRPATVGVQPGSLVPDPAAHAPTLHVFAYSPEECSEDKACDVDRVMEFVGTKPVIWIDVIGLGDVDLIARLGNAFGLHSLALEDVVNVHQRPKVEEFDDHIFIVLHMLVPGREPETEQISLFVGDGYVLSFQERRGDCLEPVRERLRHGKGRLRVQGSDYLVYALIDAVIDGYFPVLETYGEEIEILEDAIVAEPRREHIQHLHGVKRALVMLRRTVWPTRDLLNALIRDENPIVTEQTQLFLRDAYDHTIQLMDLVETYREIASGLVDVYLSSQGARMNEIMKVLTIIATIFIPLGFLAGLWGMNFDRSSPWNQPELGWRFGYVAALSIMAAVAGMLLWYFRRKGWLDTTNVDKPGNRGEGS